jgi:hypothetical protein
MIYTITDFTIEAFKEFQDKVNSLWKDESFRIYLDSLGGSVMTKDMYLDVIESIPDVEIIAMTIFSSAFVLFKNVICKKRILPSSYWMIHMEAWDVRVWEKWIARWDLEKFKLNYQKESELSDISFLTDDEKELYKEGRDVFLSNKRLKEIFSM